MSHPPFHDIGGCVFDAYGTLFDVGSVVDRCRGSVGEKADRLSALWRTKQLEYSWLRSLMGRHTDFWHVTGESLDYALEALGLTDLSLRALLMQSYLSPEAFPEVKPVLARLKAAGLKIAILSNGSPTMLAGAINAAAIRPLLDVVISVEEAGIYKPHPTAYQLAVDRLGLEAPRLCFQSANAWDVAGAACFGFRTAWINRFDQRPERLPGEPQAVLTSLGELPALLGLDAQ